MTDRIGSLVVALHAKYRVDDLALHRIMDAINMISGVVSVSHGAVDNPAAWAEGARVRRELTDKILAALE